MKWKHWSFNSWCSDLKSLIRKKWSKIRLCIMHGRAYTQVNTVKFLFTWILSGSCLTRSYRVWILYTLPASWRKWQDSRRIFMTGFQLDLLFRSASVDPSRSSQTWLNGLSLFLSVSKFQNFFVRYSLFDSVLYYFFTLTSRKSEWKLKLAFYSVNCLQNCLFLVNYENSYRSTFGGKMWHEAASIARLFS